MTMAAEISLRKSYERDLVTLNIVSLPGWVISSKLSLDTRAQNVREVLDCEGRTKFAILFTTGGKASFWSFEMASIVALMISSLIFLAFSIASICSFGSEMKSTRMW